MTRKEKIIENIKKNKVGLIFCFIIFVVLLLMSLLRIKINSTDDNSDLSSYAPKIVLNHSINNLTFSTSMGNQDEKYWNDSISMSASYLDNIYNKSLFYFNDDETTYVYCDNVGSNEIRFYLTNGINTQICAIYTYDSINYLLVLNTNVSDGYFFSIVCESVTYNTINSVDLSSLNILEDTFNYVTNSMGTIYIGSYSGDDTFNYAYQLGFDNGKSDIFNNLLENGLYTKEQYNDNYWVGYNNGVTSVRDNPYLSGLYTEQQYSDNYDRGYSDGYYVGSSEDISENGFMTMFNSILNGPFNIINGMLNFEIFGINVFNTFSFIFTIGLVAFVIKLLI